MTITYRIGFGDRFAFAAYHLSRNPIILLMTVGVLLFFAYNSVLPAIRSSPSVSLYAKVIAFMFMELLLLIAVIVFWAVLMLITMISKRNKPLYAQRTFTVAEDGLVTESEYGRSETRWKQVQKLARTRKHIFLYLSGEAAVVVPRRAFADAAQWDAFYEICKRGRSAAA